jgi:ATP-dependent RNA helicase DeaD
MAARGWSGSLKSWLVIQPPARQGCARHTNITPLKTFKELGIPANLLQGLQELGIIHPTDVQNQVIPFLIENGGDFIAQAQTGTGKTAAFGLPLLMKVNPKSPEIQGLVIAPTRELAKQIGKQLFRYTKHSEKIFVEVLCGGDNFDRQVASLQRPTHIVVATPGRLIDLIHKKALTLVGVKHLVLDEADEMLSMGFKKELLKIFGLTRARRSTWLFSATIPDAIHGLIKDCMSGKPHQLKIDKAHVVNRDIDHQFAICSRDEKSEFIASFLRQQGDNRGVIFCRTKAGAVVLGKQLTTKGFPVDVLQGDLTQKERDTVMRSFKKERTQFLIATDVAARGIDVEGLSFVIHHQLPEQVEYYTHRSGRTARAGKKGISIALIEPRERAKISKLENDLGLSFSEAHARR